MRFTDAWLSLAYPRVCQGVLRKPIGTGEQEDRRPRLGQTKGRTVGCDSSRPVRIIYALIEATDPERVVTEERILKRGGWYEPYPCTIVSTKSGARRFL